MIYCEEMTQAERILAKFQTHPDPKQRTQEALATAFGVSQSTVAMWKARGRIPGNKQDAVLAAAQKLGIDLTPSDFFEDQKGAIATQPLNVSPASSASYKTSSSGSLKSTTRAAE